MGYCSEVAIAMHKKDYDAMLDEALKLDEDIFRCLASATKATQKDNVAILYWKRTKWYDNFPEVQFVTGIFERKPMVLTVG